MLTRSILFAVLILAGKPAAADKPVLTSTDAFLKAYGMSFYGFDLCGQADMGRSYRKALREKVEHCPFTADAKAHFGQSTAKADVTGPADLQRYIAEHNRLPESLDEKRVACRKETETPAYQKTIALLAGYARGEVKFDAVVPDPCDTTAGAR
jgi:hypothetical protein